MHIQITHERPSVSAQMKMTVSAKRNFNFNLSSICYFFPNF